jgi:hypothetical protein
MKSYIKIYGPPIVKAVKALEKVAIDMPEVCIMNTEIALWPQIRGEPLINYFGGLGVISEERCGTIISKSGESLGEYDFLFEWFKKPKMSELHSLMEKIDNALTEVGVRYTITTK